MSTISKVFTVLNLVFALFLVGTVSAILSKSEDFKKKFEEEKTVHASDVDKAKKEKEQLSGEMNGTREQNRTLTNQLADRESELNAAKATAEQVRNDNNQLRGAVDTINASLKTMQAELADAQNRNKDLADKNDGFRKTTADAEKARMNAEDDRTRLETELKHANDDVAEKERQVVALTQQRDNLNAQLTGLNAAGVPVTTILGNTVPGIEGKVTDVGPGFVVLSVGQSDGVKEGYPFYVYRGSNLIGRVVVEHVLPGSSTARITQTSKGAEFKALDSATTRL